MQGKNVIDCATAAPILTFFPVNIRLYITVFLYPATQKVAGYYVIPSEPFECPFVRLSIRPSIRASFPDSNLSSFWPIFFKFCMEIDIREEWFGMAMDFFCQFWTALRPLFGVRFFYAQYLVNWFVDFDQILYMHWYWQNVDLGWLNNMFCSFLTTLWPLIDFNILFMLNILWTNWWILIKFCKCIDIDKV